MDSFDIFVLVVFCCLFIFNSYRLSVSNKENKRLREELQKQVNENLRLQNNFNTDLVK